MLGSGCRQFVHENDLCRDKISMPCFNMIEAVWRIDIVYLNKCKFIYVN
jgi:hypothetical protein